MFRHRSKQRVSSATAVVFALSAFGIGGCPPAGDMGPDNIRGTVTLDGAPLPGVIVTVEIVDGAGGSTTTTGADGTYGFSVQSGRTYRVSLGSGLPQDATCDPGLEQEVNVGSGTAAANFDCMTPGGGTGGTGGGGTGGTGGDGGTGGMAGAGGMAGVGGMAGTGGMAGSGGMAGTGGMAGSGGMAGAGGMAGSGGMAGAGGTGGAPGDCDDSLGPGEAGLIDNITASAGTVARGGEVTVFIPVNDLAAQLFLDLTSGLFLVAQAVALTSGAGVVAVAVTVDANAPLGPATVSVFILLVPNDGTNSTEYDPSGTGTMGRVITKDGIAGPEVTTPCTTLTLNVTP